MNLTFRVQKPPDIVFDYLTDMQKFASVHPVISRIEKKDEQNYLIYETLKVGFIPLSFAYPAQIKKDKNCITMRATVLKLTKIELTFNLKADGENATIVTENVKIKTLFSLKYMIELIFKKQHKQLFKNLENV